jgi:hypothetical protein
MREEEGESPTLTAYGGEEQGGTADKHATIAPLEAYGKRLEEGGRAAQLGLVGPFSDSGCSAHT